jgi:hypothetical protein
MAKKSYKQQRDVLVARIEKNPTLYNNFKKWLNTQELDIEFVMYEDSIDHPKEFVGLYMSFLRSRRKKK